MKFLREADMVKTYNITIFQNIACAERRPYNGEEEFRSEFVTHTEKHQDDLSALQSALQLILGEDNTTLDDIVYEYDLDINDEEAIKEFLDKADPSDGNPFVVAITEGNRTVYSGYDPRDYRDDDDFDESLEEDVQSKKYTVVVVELGDAFGGNSQDIENVEEDEVEAIDDRDAIIKAYEMLYSYYEDCAGIDLDKIDDSYTLEDILNEVDKVYISPDFHCSFIDKVIDPNGEALFDNEMSEDFYRDDGYQDPIDDYYERRREVVASDKTDRFNPRDVEAYYKKQKDESLKEDLYDNVSAEDVLERITSKFGNNNYQYQLTTKGFDYFENGENHYYYDDITFNAPNDYIALYSMMTLDDPSITNLIDYCGKEDVLDYLEDYPTYKDFLDYASKNWTYNKDEEVAVMSLKNLTTGDILFVNEDEGNDEDMDESLKESNNPLKDAQKAHHKKRKGLSPFGNFKRNAGNVEAGVKFFNHANGADSSCEGCGEASGVAESLQESVSYHSTKTLDSAFNIVDNGFKGDSIYLSADLYDSQGYGKYVIQVDDLDSLNLYLVPKDEMDEISEIAKKVKEEGIYDGIKYRYSKNHPYNYEIYKIDNLNKLNRKLVESLNESEEKQICCICGQEFTGWGNNAEPVKSGRCCDKCNREVVIPERFRSLRENKKLNEEENQEDITSTEEPEAKRINIRQALVELDANTEIPCYVSLFDSANLSDKDKLELANMLASDTNDVGSIYEFLLSKSEDNLDPSLTADMTNVSDSYTITTYDRDNLIVDINNFSDLAAVKSEAIGMFNTFKEKPETEEVALEVTDDRNKTLYLAVKSENGWEERINNL